MYVYLYVYICACTYACIEVRKQLVCQFSPFTILVPGIKLRSARLTSKHLLPVEPAH